MLNKIFTNLWLCIVLKSGQDVCIYLCAGHIIIISSKSWFISVIPLKGKLYITCKVSEVLVLWFSQGIIIKIITNKGLRFLTLHVMSLVSLF